MSQRIANLVELPALPAVLASANKLVTYILDKGFSGVPPLSSAQDLATEYLVDHRYTDHDKRVDSLIRWEISKNFTSGFITGLGGLVTMPVSIPSALGASWLIQARMAAAIALIYGHQLSDDRVRTLVLLSLVGDAASTVVKSAGIQLGQKLTQRAVAQLPGRILVDINNRVGFRLLTKAGERGIINLSKGIPVVGGLVGGSVDAVACRAVGRTSKNVFKRQ